MENSLHRNVSVKQQGFIAFELLQSRHSMACHWTNKFIRFIRL